MENLKFELEKVATNGKYRYGYILKISKELAEYWGFPEKPVCQEKDCHCLIKFPCYFCSEGIRLYCYDCVQSGKDVCVYNRLQDLHEHNLIVDIRIIE